MVLDGWASTHPLEVALLGFLLGKRKEIWAALKGLPEGLGGIRRTGRLRTLAKLEKVQRDPQYGWRSVLESTASLLVSMAVAGLLIFPLSLVLDRAPRGQAVTLPEVAARTWVLQGESLFATTYVFLIVTMVALNAYMSSRALRSPRTRAEALRRELGALSARDAEVLAGVEAD